MPSEGSWATRRSGDFGQPVVYGNHIVFESANGGRLICVNLSGEKIWEKKYWSPNICGQRDDGSLIIQLDRQITVLDVATGKETSLFKTRKSRERVHFNSKSGLVWLCHRWKSGRFRVLDPASGNLLWKNRHVRYVVHVSAGMVVCLTGKRGVFQPEDVAWLDDAAVEAFDSKSGQRLWKIQLPEDFNNSELRTIRFGPHILIRSRSKMICLRERDGQVISTGENENANSWYAFRDKRYARSPDGMLAQLMNREETKENRLVFRNSVHFLSVPELMKEFVRDLSVADSLSGLTCYENYIIADVGGYRGGYWSGAELPAVARQTTICLDARSGQEIWRKNHFGRSEVSDGKIYFSDFVDSKDLTDMTVRLGMIDVASGGETMLYEEKL